MTLAERLIAVHRALDAAGVPHAFGGAISLAFWTKNPRATSDIDVNIFIPAEDCARCLAVLPRGIAQPDDTEATIRRDGQTRLWWDGTPVDLFFDYEAVHGQAALNREMVRFAGERIPVLGPTELATFKAMFDRSQDWVDIQEMIAAERLDLEALRRTLSELVGPDDRRFDRLADVTRRASEEPQRGD